MVNSLLGIEDDLLKAFTGGIVGAPKPNCPFFPFVHMHGLLTMGANRAVIHLPL
jgi:hypothetical protein